MEAIEEQRVCVIFCFKLRKSSSETFELLQQAFEDNVLSRTTYFEWFKRKVEHPLRITNNLVDPRSTSKTNKTVACVREIIQIIVD